MAFYYWIWGVMTTSALVWYSTITVYIAFRGAFDIKQMLHTLSRGQRESNTSDS